MTVTVRAYCQHFAGAVAVRVPYVDDQDNYGCGEQYQEHFLKEADPAGYARAGVGDGIEVDLRPGKLRLILRAVGCRHRLRQTGPDFLAGPPELSKRY